MAGEACRKAEEENGRLADERLSMVMELGAVKDEFAAFWEKVAIYGYGCCVFTHNICGSEPHIPDGMSNPSVPLTPEFFANPLCPPSF